MCRNISFGGRRCAEGLFQPQQASLAAVLKSLEWPLAALRKLDRSPCSAGARDVMTRFDTGFFSYPNMFLANKLATWPCPAL